MIKNISLNGKWELYYDVEGMIDEKDYMLMNKKEINVPEAIEKVLEDRIFSGPFFYEKEIELNDIKEDDRYLLEFLGVSYFCQVYCNGKLVKAHEGIWDSFYVDITENVNNGINKIVVKVIKPDFDKESKFFFRSVLFGFIPDIMIPFGGIWKDVNLLIKGQNYFDEIEYKFDVDSKSIIINSILNEKTMEQLNLAVEIITPEGEIVKKTIPYSENTSIKLEQIEIWSPNKPNVYKVKVNLVEEEILDINEISAGFRKVETKDGEILLNGEKFYMRGVLHWGCYPEKFMPSLSYEEAKEELTKIKSLGFNTIKHCLYFPLKYYYELCDELGIVTWQELPLWLPHDNGYLSDRIYEQYPKMLKYFMNYPTVSLVSLGCELDATISSDTLNKLYDMVKEKDSDMIICDNSGSGECFEGVSNTSSDIYDYHFYAELYNLDGLINEFTRSYRSPKPWIFGEYNDTDTFRLVDEIEKREDEELWWLNSDEKANLLRLVHKGFGSDLPIYYQKQIFDEYGIAEEVRSIKDISYKQAYSIRKYVLELTRSYNEIKGYNITSIRDVPITTSGIFDDNMNSKFAEDEFNKINGDVVIALNKDLSRIWDGGADRFLNQDLYNYFSSDTLKGRLVISNRLIKDLQGEYNISLRSNDEVYFEFIDELVAKKDIVSQLAQLSIKLPEVKEAKVCELVVKLNYEGGTYENSWDIWIYPKQLKDKKIYLFDSSSSFVGMDELFNVKRICGIEELSALKEGDILITTYFDKKVESIMTKGVNILYYQKGEGYFPLTYNPFYREGVKKLFDHEINNNLNHVGYAGYQFYGVGTDKYFDKLEIEKILGEYTPIIRRYDARKFKAGDYMFEYRKGRGKAIVTTLNFDGGSGSQPHSFKYNNFAVYLLNTIINYFQ